MKFIFKNLEASTAVSAVAKSRLQPLIRKFPALLSKAVTVTFEMCNSPIQAGKDEYLVRFYCNSGSFRDFKLTRRSANLYLAICDISDDLLDYLKRFQTRRRTQDRRLARGFKRELG